MSSGQSALVRRDRDLRVLHAYRVPPGILGDPGQCLPHAGDPLGADRERHVFFRGGAGQFPGEVPGIRAQRDPAPRRPCAITDRLRQRGQRPAQQPRHVRAWILVTGQQVGGQRDLRLRPGRHVRPARPLPLVVVGHPAFLAAVDLHVGGVDVDRHRAFGQLRRPLGRQQAGHRRRGPGQPGLRAAPVLLREPARDPGRGRGGQARHRCQQLPGLVGADPVQADQEVLPGQLRGGHPGQHLPAGKPAAALLDRPHPLIEGRDQAQPLAQLGDREHPARSRQRRVVRPDLDPAPGLAPHRRCQHHSGDSPPETIQHCHAR